MSRFFGTPKKSSINPINSPSVISIHKSSFSDIDEEYQIKSKRKEKLSKNKNQRYESDFKQYDNEKRNILHRAALEQSDRLIKDVLQEYSDVLKQNFDKVKYEQKYVHVLEEDYVKHYLQEYIQTQDDFGCTPILICCFLNEQRESVQSNPRLDCLKILIEMGADVNSKNPQTLWAPIHWCAFYGDLESCQYLLKNQAFSFQCDRTGLFPIDLAGNNNYEQLVRLLLKHLTIFLSDCQKFWNDELRDKDEDEFIRFQELCYQYETELTNPILYCKLLFWSCHFKSNIDFVPDILTKLPRVYVQVPLYTLKSMNSIHACAFVNNYDALELIIEFETQQKRKGKSQKLEPRNYEDYKKLKDKPVKIYEMSRSEKNKYKKSFTTELKIFQKFEIDYFKRIEECIEYLDDYKIKINSPLNNEIHSEILDTNDKASPSRANKVIPQLNEYQTIQFPQQEHELENREDYELKRQKKKLKFRKSKFLSKKLLQIDMRDFYGNTALHIASLKGTSQMIKFLLRKHADPNIENKEFFKARQISKDTEVINYFHTYLQKLKYDAQKKNQEMQLLVNLMTKINRQKPHPPYIDPEVIVDGGNEDEESLQKRKLEIHKRNQIVRNELRGFSADIFVPDLVIKCFLKSQSIFQTRDSSSEKIKQMQRLNFQISLLQNADFDVYLMESLIEEHVLYIMLRLSEDKLEEEAERQEIQVKLIDSYDLEPYKIKDRQLFEPLRSRQRQIIVENHLRNSVNIDSLKKSHTIDCYYLMHTAGGIQIVKQYWQKFSYYIIPQPFNQIDDYFREGKSQNFTSLTVLRLYFGEKTSFYFAWLSFQTCALLFVAIPGIILQIYILTEQEFHLNGLVYWSFAMCIWSTVQKEFWKRKTSELNTRWGCIDLMIAQEDSTYTGPFKEGFSGDDEISYITGKLSKHQKISKTFILSSLFIFVGFCFIGFSVLIILGIDQFRLLYNANSSLFNFFLGVVQALEIQLLNQIFSYFSLWSTKEENHKYELNYERSLIYKDVIFKLTNSYLPVFYFIVLRDDATLQDLFFLILPLIFVKKIYFFIIDVAIPAIYIRIVLKNYFSHVQGTKAKYLDPIERFWAIKIQTQIISTRRAVLKVDQELSICDRLKTNQLPEFEIKLDTDAVEMNSQRRQFEGTYNYYMEGLIDYGYAILFAAAIPGAPFLMCLFNSIDIQLKIYKLLYLNKRARSERCAGIGEWGNIVEFINIFGVFSNFIILYYKNKEQTFSSLDISDSIESNSDWNLGIFLAFIVFLIIFNQFISDFIPDRPEWVRMEIDKIIYKAEKDSQEKAIKQTEQVQQQTKEYRIQTKKCNEEIMQLKQKFQSDSLELENRQLNLKKKLEGKQNYLSPSIRHELESKTEYDMVVLGNLNIRYLYLDHLLTLRRMEQILNSGQVIQLCQECSFRPSFFECIECDQNYCGICFDMIHQQLKHKVHLLVPEEELNHNLEINIASKVKTNNIFKYTKDQKQNFTKSIPQKEWKKIEYFSLPVNENSAYYQDLLKAFDFFMNYYIIDPGLEFRDFKLNLNSLFQLNVNEFLNNFRMFNIEDKLFLNKLAYSVYKQKRHLTSLQHFLKSAQQFQEGMLEQKICLFYQFLDRTNDQIIYIDEIENLFLQSNLQNMGGNLKISDIIEELCPQKQMPKKEILNRLMAGLTKKKFRPFLEGYLQTRE